MALTLTTMVGCSSPLEVEVGHGYPPDLPEECTAAEECCSSAMSEWITDDAQLADALPDTLGIASTGLAPDFPVESLLVVYAPMCPHSVEPSLVDISNNGVVTQATFRLRTPQNVEDSSSRPYAILKAPSSWATSTVQIAVETL